jgi:hypothetical protein
MLTGIAKWAHLFELIARVNALRVKGNSCPTSATVSLNAEAVK